MVRRRGAGGLVYDEEQEVLMKIQRIDHVGVVVRDLAAAKAFFIDLGLSVVGEAELAGAWVDQVVGLDGVKAASCHVTDARW